MHNILDVIDEMFGIGHYDSDRNGIEDVVDNNDFANMEIARDASHVGLHQGHCLPDRVLATRE